MLFGHRLPAQRLKPQCVCAKAYGMYDSLYVKSRDLISATSGWLEVFGYANENNQ